VRFLWAKGLNAKDIHKEIISVYGGKYLSRKAVHNWVQKFSQGRWEVAEATVQRVEELIRADRRITIYSVATALGCSHGLAYSIMHACMKFRKACTCWVSRELKDREKISHMGLSLQYLIRYANEGEDMLNGIVTGDESCQA
jgi:ribosomal protein S25